MNLHANYKEHCKWTFPQLRMFKIVFGGSPLRPKQLSLFCLLWLNSASADGIGYITSFCSMIKLLYELKIAVAQHDFLIVNCSDAVMSVFYSTVVTLSLIFL